jgi:hypothetical protein
MLKTKKFSFLFTLSSLFGYGAATFTPATPLVYPGSSVANPGGTIVSATSNGFMATWQDSGSKNLVTTISIDQGTSWSPLQIIGPTIPATYGWVTGNATGFLSGGVELDPSSTNITYFTSLYTPLAPSWTPPQNINGTKLNFNNGTPGICLAASDKAFIASWAWVVQDEPLLTQNIYASGSLDGIKWFAEPVFVGTTHYQNFLPVFPSACAKGDVFLITWLDNELFEVKVALSSDEGASWSDPVTVSIPGFTTISYPQVGCFACEEGFLLSYRDDVALYSVFSADGVRWSTSVVTTQVTQVVSDYIPAVSGNSRGFAIAWVGTDNNVYVNISEDQGMSWGSPIAVTHDGSVLSPNISNITLSIQNDQCILGWINSAGNAVTCYATFSD